MEWSHSMVPSSYCRVRQAVSVQRSLSRSINGVLRVIDTETAEALPVVIEVNLPLDRCD